MPVAADQPMRGGMAPTTLPTQVLTILTLFIGVYTHVYRNKFNKDKDAHNPLT